MTKRLKRKATAALTTKNKKTRLEAGTSSEEPSGSSAARSESSVPVAAAPPDRRATVEEVEDVDNDVVIIEPPEEDPEAELQRLSAKWDAPCYAFYKEHVAIEYHKGRRCHVFSCANPRCSKTIRRFLDTGDARSTSNLRQHVASCWGPEALEAADRASTADLARPHVEALGRTGTITAAFERISEDKESYSTRPFTPIETRVETVCWVTTSGRPCSIIEDPGLRRLLKTGRPEYQLTSAKTLQRDVLEVYEAGCRRVRRLLEVNDSKVHFQTDAWTAPNHRSFIALVVNVDRNGKRLRFLLDIHEVPEGHTGVVLAREFEETLRVYGVVEKLLAITVDNASANDAMIRQLESSIPSFPGAENQVRCFAHVLNLVAKTIIRQFDTGKVSDEDFAGEEVELQAAALAEIAASLEADVLEVGGVVEAEDGPGNATDGDGDVDDNVDGWIDEREDLSVEEREELRASILPMKLILAKLRKLANSMVNSSTKLLPAWKTLLASLKLAVRTMPRDVATRWNSTFEMLNFALSYRVAIDKMTDDRALDLRRLELREEEWKLVEQLCDVLKVFHDASLFFSRGDGSPLIATVIPAIDHIDERLTSYSLNSDYCPAIRAACALGKRTLNRYYSRTDDSNMYRVCMVLHPSYKFSYFRRLNWEPEWIRTSKSIVQEIWLNNYASRDIPADTTPIMQSTQDATVNQNIFDNLASGISEEPTGAGQDELERYLAEPCKQIDGDILKWWYGQRDTYPRLSRMALDFLSAPATTVDVERVFSKGRILLSHTRNRLSANNTRAMMCVGEWTRLGLIRSDDIKVAVKAGSSRANEDNDEDIEAIWDHILRTAEKHERQAATKVKGKARAVE